MSNKAFQQNLDDKKGPQPGGPYLIQMLFLGKPHGPPEHGEGKLGKGLSVILGVFRDVCLAVLSI